jgi:hypothetical protein
LKHVIVVGESSFRLGILLGGLPLSLFDMLIVIRRFKNLMLPLWFTFLGVFFVFLDVGPSILFLVFPLFKVLWFIL